MKTILIASGLMLASFSASAVPVNFVNSVGVNFYNDDNPEGSIITANQGAGVVGQTNWNNETFVGRFDSCVSCNTGTVTTVNNNTGAVEAGLSYTWSGANNAWYGAGDGTTGNDALFNGYFEGDYLVGTGPTVSVTGVNYAAYDVYVYLSSAASTVSIGEESFSYPNTYTASGLMQANSNGDLANYALFSGLTGENFQIDMALISGNRAGIAGFQIVEVSAVPVPAAVWLFGTGLLGLVGVARRK